ncbi:MAG: TldD/PmbA family protein, partial [Bacillota bacterium]
MAKIFQSLPSGVQGELMTRRVQSIEVSFSDSEFQDIQNSINASSTLRVIKDGRMSVATSTKPDSEEQLVANALASVRFGTPVKYDLPGAADLAKIELADERQLDTKTMVEIADDLTQSLLRYDPRIRANAGVGRDEVEVRLANSNGFDGSYRKTIWGAGLGGQLIQGDDFLWLGEQTVSIGPDLDYEALKKDVLQQFIWAKNTVPFAAGTYPVIFAPIQMGFLMTPFLACLNGKAIARGISPWKEKMSEQLLDPRVNLIDDGTMARKTTSAPFDREGTPTQRNLLIKDGVANQMLLDLQTAQELGRISTGNGTAGGPAAHRIILTPGTTPVAEMIKAIDMGLIIFGSMGAWTGNPYGGTVSGTISMG